MFDNILYLLLCGYLSTAGLIKQPCKPVERQWHMGSYIYILTRTSTTEIPTMFRGIIKSVSHHYEKV